MNSHEWYLNNSKEINKKLYEIEYTPHTLVADAAKEDMNVFDYIKLLLS